MDLINYKDYKEFLDLSRAQKIEIDKLKEELVTLRGNIKKYMDKAYDEGVKDGRGESYD